MSEPGFCEYSDVYIHVKGTKKVPDAEADAVARQGDGRNKQVIFKNCAPFTDCLSEYTMAMYNSIKYRSNYLKTSDIFQQNCRNDSNTTIKDYEAFKFKGKITGKAFGAGHTKNFEIVIPLKYLSNIQRCTEIAFNNCKSYLVLNWPVDCLISTVTEAKIFTITDKQLYFPVVAPSTEDKKLLQQFKSVFKHTTNRNKHQSKVSMQRQNNI